MDCGAFGTKQEWTAFRLRMWRQKNAERVKAYDKARYWANREERLARSKAWAAKNSDVACARSKAWKQANREHVNAQKRAQRASNPEKARAAEKRKYHAKPGVYKSRRNGRLKQATPPWVDHAAIRVFYDLAAVLGMHVDHIHPLKGRNFCGLHVPWNLQLLTASENAAKGNKLVDGV